MVDTWTQGRSQSFDHSAVWFIMCRNKPLFDNLYPEIIPCCLQNSIDFSDFQGVFSSNFGVTTRSNIMHNRSTILDLFEDWLRFSIDSFCLSAGCTSLNEQFTTKPLTLLNNYIIHTYICSEVFTTPQNFQFRTWSVCLCVCLSVCTNDIIRQKNFKLIKMCTS